MLAGVGIAGIVAMQPPPPPPDETYKAVGQLTFTEPPPAFTSTGSQLQAEGRAVTRGTLLSERVLRNVQEQLQLKTEELLKIRDKALKIQFPEQDNDGQRLSSVISLEYTDKETPTRATLILETFMEAMEEHSRWLNTSELRSRIEALSKRLAQVQQDLTAAENRFYRYVSQEGSDLLAVQDGSLFSGITSSQQRQRELQLALQEIDGRINSLINQLGLTPEQAYTSVALSADPILANLRAQILQTELQLERLQIDLKPEHPTIIQLLKQKKVNEALLQQRAQELMGARDLAPVPISQIRQDSSLDPSRQQLASQLLNLQTQRAGLF